MDGVRASFLLDGIFIEDELNYYFYDYEFDFSRIAPHFSFDNTYAPRLKFLGWYVDENFINPINSIVAHTRGTITVYAKWRYDYDDYSRSGVYTITDSGRFNQAYDDGLYINLTRNNLYENLNRLGIKYLGIHLKIQLWEVNDGYQYIYLYDGVGADAKLLCDEIKIAHSGVGASSSPKVYERVFLVPLSEIQDCDELCIRFGASGNFEDTWKNDSIYIEMMCIAENDEEKIKNPELPVY